MVLRDEEVLDKDEKIALLNDEIHKLMVELEKKEELIKILNENINKLLNILKNNLDEKRISDVTDLIVKTKYEISKLKKEINITEFESELKNYIKGKFVQFIKEKSALEILINGVSFYYPLSCYQNAYLPLPDSRVIIFKTVDNQNLIYGFEIAKMLPLAKKYCGEIKFFSTTQKRVKLFIEKIGYVNFYPDDDFFCNNFKIGDKIILREIIIEANSYFLIEKEDINEHYERKEILKILKD
jgi:hypothetical protein